MKKFIRNIIRFIRATLSFVRVIMIIGMVVVVGISAYLIHTAYKITLNQYNESLTWESTNYSVPRAEIDPALVSNVVDTDAVKAAEAWNALEAYIDGLDGRNMDRKKADEIMNEAVHWQKIYNLDSESVNRLSLYLKIEDEIPKAYSTLKTGKLAKLSVSLRNMELEKKTKSGQQYMKRLRDVVEDFAAAKDTLTDTILSVGTLKDGVWTIPYTYERDDLADILEQIQTMRKFPALGDTVDVLSDVASTLNYNKNARDYFAYRKFMHQMSVITRSDYIAISSVYTYGQALDYGLVVDVEEKEGFIINRESSVTGIYYDGKRLDDDMYIRNGANVIVYIDPIYEEKPEPVVDEPEIIEPETTLENEPEVFPTEAPELTSEPTPEGVYNQELVTTDPNQTEQEG